MSSTWDLTHLYLFQRHKSHSVQRALYKVQKIIPEDAGLRGGRHELRQQGAQHDLPRQLQAEHRVRPAELPAQAQQCLRTNKRQSQAQVIRGDYLGNQILTCFSFRPFTERNGFLAVSANSFLDNLNEGSEITTTNL